MKNDKIKTAAVQHNIITKKSQAIYHSTIKQPISQIGPLVRKVGHNMDIARSKSIAHFSPHSVAAPAKPSLAKKQFDIGPAQHPLAAKVEKRRLLSKAVVKPTPDKSSKATKERMIAEAFSKLNESQEEEKKVLKRKYKIINFFIIGILILVIIGYFIFINLSAISVSVASAQAGINASYPGYCPDGYSLNGPVTYSDGLVTINFKANTGNQKFIITQARSSWDSSAVMDKVSKESNGMFVTTEENGLTIYTYNGNADWVNGGILYTITGNAFLSSSQIRHIATSL